MSQFLKVKTRPALTPYYSIRACCDARNMLYESFKVPREARRRQHMRQHGKFENLGVKRLTKRVFFEEFSDFFPLPEASGGFWRGWRVDFDVF